MDVAVVRQMFGVAQGRQSTCALLFLPVVSRGRQTHVWSWWERDQELPKDAASGSMTRP